MASFASFFAKDKVKHRFELKRIINLFKSLNI